MKLRVLLPTKTLVDADVTKVIAEAENGSFCLLPRHADFVTVLIPGLLFFEASSGSEEYVAVDEGVLVKVGADVLVSTRNAVRGAELGRLREAVETQFRELDEKQRMARSAVARVEANLVRRFIELDERGHV